MSMKKLLEPELKGQLYLKSPCKTLYSWVQVLKLSYNYKKFNTVLRPIIPITLKFNDKETDYFALIDSGADLCIFPKSIAERLEIDLSNAQILDFSGVQAQINSKAYLVAIELGLRSQDTVLPLIYFHAPILFSNDVLDNNFGIVGQLGFFSEFEVKMNYAKELIELEKE